MITNDKIYVKKSCLRAKQFIAISNKKNIIMVFRATAKLISWHLEQQENPWPGIQRNT